MASHDYYNSYPPRLDHNTEYHGRTNQPLPPIPSSPSTRPQQPYVDTSGISPVHSPFDDHAYPAYPRPSQSHSHTPDYADTRPSYSHDPFRDSNAIPLQQGLKGPHVSGSPTSGMGEAEQQYASSQRDHKGQRNRTRRRKEQGWFRGRITWAVFLLTLVQLIVFIVEIVRNG